MSRAFRRRRLGAPGRGGRRLGAPHLPGDDAGSAVVEFLGVTLVLLVPVVYLVLVLGQLQAAAFAVESAAAGAGRAFTVAADDASAQAGAEAAVRLALADQGLDAAVAGDVLRVECAPGPCREPGSTVAVTVRVEVALPLVPGFVRSVVPLSVPVETTAVHAVDRYVERSAP